MTLFPRPAVKHAPSWLLGTALLLSLQGFPALAGTAPQGDVAANAPITDAPAAGAPAADAPSDGAGADGAVADGAPADGAPAEKPAASDASTAKAPPPGSVPTPHLDPSLQITPAKDVYPDIELGPKQVDEAFKTAAKTHRKVLLDFGGNWCPDCRKLAGVFNVPSVERWLDANFVVVPVNVGRIDKNLDLAAKYGIKIQEVPTVLILTPDGHLLNADGTHTLGNARAMSAQAVIDLIDQWNQRG